MTAYISFRGILNMKTIEELTRHYVKVAMLLKEHPQLQSIIAPIRGESAYPADNQKIKEGLAKMNIPEITFAEKKTISFDL